MLANQSRVKFKKFPLVERAIQIWNHPVVYRLREAKAACYMYVYKTGFYLNRNMFPIL